MSRPTVLAGAALAATISCSLVIALIHPPNAHRDASRIQHGECFHRRSVEQPGHYDILATLCADK